MLLLLLLLREIADEATLIQSALAVRFCTRDRRAESVGPLRLEGQDMRRGRVHPLRRDGSRRRRRRRRRYSQCPFAVRRRGSRRGTADRRRGGEVERDRGSGSLRVQRRTTRVRVGVMPRRRSHRRRGML